MKHLASFTLTDAIFVLVCVFFCAVSTGCFVLRSTVRTCDNVCKQNGGCSWVNTIIFPGAKFQCENGAQFQSDSEASK